MSNKINAIPWESEHTGRYRDVFLANSSATQKLETCVNQSGGGTPTRDGNQAGIECSIIRSSFLKSQAFQRRELRHYRHHVILVLTGRVTVYAKDSSWQRRLDQQHGR